MVDELCDIIRDNYNPFEYQKGKYNIQKAAKEQSIHVKEFIIWIITDMKNEYKVTCVNTSELKALSFVKDDVFYTLNEVYLLWLAKQ